MQEEKPVALKARTERMRNLKGRVKNSFNNANYSKV
jgi:hypothetical protein